MVGEGDRGGDLSWRGATPVLVGALGLGMGLATGMGLPVGDEDLDEEGETELELELELEEDGAEDVASLSSPSDLDEGPILGRLSWSDEPRSDSDLAFFRGREGPEGSVNEGRAPSLGSILGEPPAEAEGPGRLSVPNPIGTVRIIGSGLWVRNSAIAWRPLRDGPGVLIMGDCAPTPEGKKIASCLCTVCSLSGVTVEAPYKRGAPGQCHRCQLYGHSAIDCPRVKETATEPPSCVLCRKQGHTANYRGCPKAPRKRPANAPPKTAGPKTSAPRAPKPAFVPAPVPTVSAWAKPLPFTKAGTTPAPQPRYAPPPLLAPRPAPAPAPGPAPRPGPARAPTNDFSIIRDYIAAINIDRMRSFADAMRRAVTADDRLYAKFDHMDVIESVQRTLV
ncbi:skin secretory protein xP2-like [Bombyx mandarina]|uniref:Skin secretory protein xP2-like n=1 Tax=Bombyx mandarina TaxID=7092 RepID=A0A6J2KBW1_BOMMA|nr:skin secretory protein xP2-like [Bombyx mandarina]